MSFEANNDMNTIHLGNYEEFIILYLDNELSEEQVKMVDNFLAGHPDLKAELEMLKSAKLPLEDFSFDKTALMAEHMKLSSADEELLLYIDDELPADEKKKLDLELASNKEYQLQHQVLLQTKLDPSEKIAYPNKEELYRKTKRVVAFKVWMRVAAAIIIIVAGGLLYFKNDTLVINPGTTAGNKPVQKIESKENKTIDQPIPSFEIPQHNEIAVTTPLQKETKQNKTVNKQEVKVENSVENNNEIVQINTPQEIKEDVVERPVVKNIQANDNRRIQENIAAINNSHVTSPLLERTTNETSANGEEPLASNDRKGSVKGFLRKATRMIEKRTGIDPTNDGELFIGAVAINLK